MSSSTELKSDAPPGEGGASRLPFGGALGQGATQ
jgi:hypothetical protein